MDCYAHQLNLAIEHSCEQTKEVQDAINDAKALYNFIEGSVKRHELFQYIRDPATFCVLKQVKVWK
jgi:hypothetical protein